MASTTTTTTAATTATSRLAALPESRTCTGCNGTCDVERGAFGGAQYWYAGNDDSDDGEEADDAMDTEVDLMRLAQDADECHGCGEFFCSETSECVMRTCAWCQRAYCPACFNVECDDKAEVCDGCADAAGTELVSRYTRAAQILAVACH